MLKIIGFLARLISLIIIIGLPARFLIGFLVSVLIGFLVGILRSFDIKHNLVFHFDFLVVFLNEFPIETCLEELHSSYFKSLASWSAESLIS